MDLTQLFKASVKTVRLRCKALPDKSRILKTRSRDDFLLKANDVRYQVTQLRNLLIENRPAYMRFGYHLKTATQMTDQERDIIDCESEKIILICNQYICDLKNNILKNNDNSKKQLLEHKLAILDILTNYLKSVYRLHNEQKENRIKHEVETLKLLKLRANEMKQSYKNESKLTEHIVPTPINDEKKNSSKTMEHRKKLAIDEDQASRLGFGYDINHDDLQVLEFENSQILNDFKGLTDEVDQIEKHVTGIAKLQEIFTEKVSC